MPRLSRLVALAALLVVAAPAAAQTPNDPSPPAAAKKRTNKFFEFADVSFELDKLKVKRGETVTAKLTITPKNGAWTYPFRPADPTQPSTNTQPSLPATPDYVVLSRSADQPGAKEKPRFNAPGKIDQYYIDGTTWVYRVVVPLTATPGKKAVALGKDTMLQVCNDNGCFTIVRDEIPKAEFEVIDEPAENPNRADLDAAAARLTPPAPAPVAEAVGPKPTKPLAEYEADLEAIRRNLVSDTAPGGTGPTGKDEGLGAFLATAALWGLISLVTPCVFPMIPITVSIFLKQAHGSLGERLKLAGVYSLTIVTVLGFSAFALLKFMAVLAAHPATNIALGVLFFVLALSLFGMYELTLPNSFARRLQSKQAKGGVVGTIFGALAFTVISFTCVAPFLGGFAGISAGAGSGDGQLVALPTTREVLGGLAFATAFAAPFFVLALVPGLLKALPRSGGWLDSVKVVMGFLEVAAALKFFRTAELRLLPTPEYFTYDVVLAGWVVLLAACGLYLLNLYRLPHDEERPNIGVPRLLFATTFLGLAVYLAPALLKPAEGKRPRPGGAVYAWVEAFLLPEHAAGHADTDLKDAIERARRLNRPVFVDFTGETCTNCRYNEQSVFTRPEVAALLDQFVPVQLYTDSVPATAYRSDPGREHRTDEAYANRSFEVDAFGTSALPTYAVLIPQPDGTVRVFREPGGERRGTIEGKINSVSDFAAFLRAALEAPK